MAQDLTARQDALPLMPPSMPPGLKSLLVSPKRIVIDEDNQSREVEADWFPPVVDAKQRVWIETRALPQFDAYLAPADAKTLAARVTVLLSHGYVADVPPAVMRGIIADWVQALADLPMWAIEAACRTWIAEDRRKPTAADIRALALAEAGPVMEERDKLKSIVNAPAPQNSLVEPLSRRLPAAELRHWIVPLEVWSEAGRVIVRCPSAFHRDWVERNYRSQIEAEAGKSAVFLRPGQVPPEEKPVDRGAADRAISALMERFKNDETQHAVA